MLRPYRHLSEKRQINVKATKIPNMWGVGPFDVHKVLLHTNWYLETSRRKHTLPDLVVPTRWGYQRPCGAFEAKAQRG